MAVLSVEDYARINQQSDNAQKMRQTLQGAADTHVRQTAQQQAFAKANTPAVPASPSATPQTATGKVLAKLRGAAGIAKKATPVAATISAMGSMNTPTEDYAKRIGVDPADAGVGTRALGVLQDLGNTLTLNMADRVGNAIAGNGFDLSPHLQNMKQTLTGQQPVAKPAEGAPVTWDNDTQEVVNDQQLPTMGLLTPQDAPAKSTPDLNMESVNLLRNTLAQAQQLQDPMKAQTDIKLPENANIFQTLMALTGAHGAAAGAKTNNDIIKTNMDASATVADGLQGAAKQQEAELTGEQSREAGKVEIESGQISLDNLKKLRDTFAQYESLNDETDPEGKQRTKLAEQALLLQGKEPKAVYDFKMVDTGKIDQMGQAIKQLVRVNTRTGVAEQVDAGTPAAGVQQFQPGQFYQTPRGVAQFVGYDADGQPQWDDGK